MLKLMQAHTVVGTHRRFIRAALRGVISVRMTCFEVCENVRINDKMEKKQRLIKEVQNEV